MSFLKTVANRIGFDGAIAYSSFARITQAAASFIVLFFIASLLSPEEQGYYYTFGSLAGIQVFFELGFTGIMTQYVAHEVAHLKLLPNNEYEGEEKYISRLAYLMRFCLKWYLVITVLFLVVVIIVGLVFFEKNDTSEGYVDWIWPWILMSFATAVKLFQSPFNAILIGLGKVTEMNKVLFYQQLFAPASLILSLFMGLKLYSVGISIIVGAIVWFTYVFCTPLLKLVYKLWRHHISEKVSYMKEIFPYQWKIALSWISGYFIFQLFNPVLFATDGAVVAGQMGMTISVLTGVQSLSLSWQNTKIPRYSGLIEMKQFKELDRLFNLTTKQMTVVSLFINMLLIGFIIIVNKYNIVFWGIDFSNRFLSISMFCIMALAIFLNQIIYSWATYLRCHKQEPYLVLSVVEGLLCLISTFFFGKMFGLVGIVLGYITIIVFQTLWAFYIFNKKKNEWHGCL